MKVLKVGRGLLALALGSMILSGCAVDADDDPDTVVSPGPDVTIEDKTPDVNVKAPDVTINNETTPSSNTTGGG